MHGYNSSWVGIINKEDKSSSSDYAKHKAYYNFYIINKSSLFIHGITEKMLCCDKLVEKISKKTIVITKVYGKWFLKRSYHGLNWYKQLGQWNK